MEEIEILDLDEDIIKKKKEKEKEIKKDNNLKDKKKEKRKLKKGEKIFLLVNIFIILCIIAFYGYRTVYYYKESHNVSIAISLKDKLTALTNIAYQNDGLYEKNGYFYYKGSNVNNYVYYSGRIYRIIDINNGIKMIEDETNTNLIWGMNDKFSESTVHEWLKKYLNTLKDYEVYLQENEWCNESVDVEDYSCSEKTKDYVGLLSVQEYLQAGGKNSYLNNETFFWTLNDDKDGKALYVNNLGSINNISSQEDNYFSYGVRPVITLKEETIIIKGDGTKDNPFIIENLGNAMLKGNSVGSFVKYNNELFRIQKIEEDGITLIYNDVIKEEKSYNDVLNYLNNDFIKKFDSSDLVKIDYIINEYNYDNKYDYTKEVKKESNYITIPSIGDLFINEFTNYWLNSISDSKLGLYYTIDDNKMLFGDLKGNKHFIRPIIKVNSEMVVRGGLGTLNDPLIVGEEHVEKD